MEGYQGEAERGTFVDIATSKSGLVFYLLADHLSTLCTAMFATLMDPCPKYCVAMDPTRKLKAWLFL